MARASKELEKAMPDEKPFAERPSAQARAVAPALAERVRAAAAGDRDAAAEVLAAVQDDVYGLALRMLGHPADAEDAAQEILVIALTHLPGGQAGSFRGESGLRTWVWRIAANHLARVRRGRRETVTFDAFGDRLRKGLRDEAHEAEETDGRPDPEADALAAELRLRCTEAMLLALDRDLRLAYLLGDVFDLSSDEGAEVLSIDPAAFRKRLSRARLRLHEFVREWCGLYDLANPCRCAGQVQSARDQGLIAPDDLYLSMQRQRPPPAVLRQAAGEVTELIRVAELLRGPVYATPEGLVTRMRALLDSGLELLR
jgi:RNA polymerase sigma factor (sigma-70 family)